MFPFTPPSPGLRLLGRAPLYSSMVEHLPPSASHHECFPTCRVTTAASTKHSAPSPSSSLCQEHRAHHQTSPATRAPPDLSSEPELPSSLLSLTVAAMAIHLCWAHLDLDLAESRAGELLYGSPSPHHWWVPKPTSSSVDAGSRNHFLPSPLANIFRGPPSVVVLPPHWLREFLLCILHFSV